MKFSSYPVATAVQDTDTFLIHQASSNSEKQVSTATINAKLSTFSSVKSIADLKAIDVTTITDAKQVNVAGYYLPGDGGGGVFYYQAANISTDNGGTVISPNIGTGRWLRAVFSVMNALQFGAKGDGATSDTAALQATITAASVAGIPAYIPAPPSSYFISASVELPSNVVVYGDGYASLLTASHVGTFQFMRQVGFNSATPQTNITVRGLRFLRTNNLLGTEGPYDGAIELTYSSKLLVENCQFYSSMTGVHFYECTDWEARGCIGYSQGDITVRVNTDATNPSAKRGVVQDCHSENAGFQLDGVTPCPAPSGPIGSSFLTTQSDTSWFNNTCVNGRYNAFECGGLLTGLLIDGFYAYADLAGRSASFNITDSLYAIVRNVHIVCNNTAAGAIYGSNVNHAVIENVSKKDLYTYTIAGGNNQLVGLPVGCTFNRISNATSQGARCINASGANTIIQNCVAENAPKDGFALDTGVNIEVENCVAINCGYNTNESAGDRLGFRIDNLGAGARIINCLAYDSRAGGARTQNYGFYVNAGALVWRNNVGRNNITGALTVTGAPTLVSEQVAVTSQIMFTKAGVISDADFLMTPPDGTIGLNTSDKKIAARIGGSWYQTAALT